MTDYVAYYRVSTQRQNVSGLGLEAQERAVEYIAQGSVIKAFTEIESGRKNDRPVLAEALAYAKANKATLLIAKVDRLARNVRFVAELLESEVPIKAADMPEANVMVLQLMSVMAEQEARMISERTIAALQSAKERGISLGGIRYGSMETNRNRGNASAISLYSLIESIPNHDNLSLQAIADALNSQGHKTIRGNTFSPMQVKRAIDRHRALSNEKAMVAA